MRELYHNSGLTNERAVLPQQKWARLCSSNGNRDVEAFHSYCVKELKCFSRCLVDPGDTPGVLDAWANQY